jgi:hypothetical protein
MSKFGFTVKRHEEWRSDPRGWEFGKRVTTDRWDVYLPHSCDEWCISEDYVTHGVSLEIAHARLEAFIKEAQEALDHLERKVEFGDE